MACVACLLPTTLGRNLRDLKAIAKITTASHEIPAVSLRSCFPRISQEQPLASLAPAPASARPAAPSGGPTPAAPPLPRAPPVAGTAESRRWPMWQRLWAARPMEMTSRCAPLLLVVCVHELPDDEKRDNQNRPEDQRALAEVSHRRPHWASALGTGPRHGRDLVAAVRARYQRHDEPPVR